MYLDIHTGELRAKINQDSSKEEIAKIKTEIQKVKLEGKKIAEDFYLTKEKEYKEALVNAQNDEEKLNSYINFSNSFWAFTSASLYSFSLVK